MRTCVRAEPPDCCRSHGGFCFRSCWCDPSFALFLNLLLSSASYLFHLLRVRIKKGRAPGSTARDGMTFRANRRMVESAHALIGCSVKGHVGSSARRPYRTEGNSTRVKLSFYYYFREKIQKRKVADCKYFMNTECVVSLCPSRIPSLTKSFRQIGAGYTLWIRKLPLPQTSG